MNYDLLTLRMVTIIQRLEEGETLSKIELANEFGVSERTVQRDMNSRIGIVIPLVYENGKGWKKAGNNKPIMHQTYAPILQQREKTMTQIQNNIMRARDAIESAESLLITAGAGMGVDSGLPDFRGTEGFWRAYPPMKRLGLEFHDMANPKWFHENSQMAWGFYGHRLNLYRATEPHQGFTILRKLIELKGDNYFVFTSNVDGQFQKAGFDINKIVERHGSIHYSQCIDRCSSDIWPNSDVNIAVNPNTFLATSDLPRCKYCDKLSRPNILMFGDWGYLAERTREQQERLYEWIRETVSKNLKITVIEIGAGKDVPTVRQFSEDMMQQYGANLVRINPRDYDGPQGIIALPLGGLEGLDKIFNS